MARGAGRPALKPRSDWCNHASPAHRRAVALSYVRSSSGGRSRGPSCWIQMLGPSPVGNPIAEGRGRLGRLKNDAPVEGAMVLALVLAFDARKTIFGKLTSERPELVVRALDTSELRAASRFQVEVRGGRVDLAAAFGKNLEVTVHPKAETKDSWTGWIELKVPGQFDALPVVRAIREVRGMSDRLLAQYQGGAGTIRLDFKERPADPFAVLAKLR